MKKYFKHGHAMPNILYRDQAFEPLRAIGIGGKGWIGQDPVITLGVEIGEICVGTAAHIFSIYDLAQASWVKPKASMQDQHLQGEHL